MYGIRKRKRMMKIEYPITVINAMNNLGYAVPKIQPVLTKDRIDGMLYAISMLPERMQIALREYYSKENSFEEVGKKLDISRQGAQQMCKRAMKELMRPNRSVYLYYGLQGAKMFLEKAMRIPIQEGDIIHLPEPDYIAKLRLSTRTYNALMQRNIKTIGQLLMMNEDDLMDIKGLGRKGVDEIFSLWIPYIKQYAEIYDKNSGLFAKIDNCPDFTDYEKELIKGAFSEVQMMKSAECKST